MSTKRLVGIVLLVIGIILLVLGLQATDSIGESIQEGITGKFSDETTLYIIGGAVAAVVGAAMAFLGGRDRTG
jgi:hypothetical protein